MIPIEALKNNNKASNENSQLMFKMVDLLDK